MLCSVNSTPMPCSRASRCGQRHQFVALLWRHAGGGFVHQQELRAVRQSDSEFDALDVAVGEHAAARGRACASMPTWSSSASASSRNCEPRRRQGRRGWRRARAAPSARSRPPSAKRRSRRSGRCGRRPGARCRVGRQADQFVAVETDRAGVGSQLAVDHVEAGRSCRRRSGRSAPASRRRRARRLTSSTAFTPPNDLVEAAHASSKARSIASRAAVAR